MNFYTCFHNACGEKWKRTCMRIPLNKPDVLFRYPIAIYMRITFVVLVFTLFCSLNASQAFGQNISISVKKLPLESVFKIIEKQSGYLFWCEKELLQKARPVDVAINNATLEQALDACLKDQGLTYAIKGKTIVIKAKDKLPEKTSGNLKTVTVTGQVINEAGRFLPNVSVRQKGSEKIAVTDKDGRFQIEVTNINMPLQFTYVGYEPLELQAGKANVVTLISRSSKLDDVQVIAYGTTTRRLSTGSISTVRAKDIENQPVSNPLAALQGRVPGLVISQTSGVAGSSFNVQIRGQSSLDLSLSQNDPLFVIDGVPFEPGNSPSSRLRSAATSSAGTGGLSPLNTINPMDIESIDVLKDADATSIYGSRGANGVIIITTKKGKIGTTSFGVNLYSGFSRVGRTLPLLNTEQYVAVRKEAFINDGLKPSSDPSAVGFAPDIMLWDTTRYTDFKKVFIDNTAFSNNVQGTLSGGSADTQFLIAGNYHRETTVFSKDFADDIGSLRFNLNHSSSDKRFSITLSGSYTADRNRLPSTDLAKFIYLPPNLLLKDNDGKLVWEDKGVVYAAIGDLFTVNPFAYLLQKYSSLNENLTGNLQIKYKITPSLDFKTNVGYNLFQTDESRLNPSTAISPLAAGFGALPSSDFNNASNRNWIIEPQLEYRKSIGKNAFTALVGSTFQDKTGKRISVSGTNYTSDLLLSSVAAAGTVTSSNDFVKYRYTALFGRINYNYNDKYIINLTARRDGSSRFGPEQQWANFGSIGLAWLFQKEEFISENLPFLSYGKFRGSYGTTGNDQIGDYKYLNLWSNSSTKYDGLSGLNPKSLYNPDYAWEINRKFEVGIELGFLKDDILIDATYYNNNCSNQLINYILPSQTGFGTVVKNFPGKVRNTGMEFTITTRNFHNSRFSWSTAFNISVPKNKLVSFPGLSASSYKNKYMEGESLSIRKGFKFLGIDPQTGLYQVDDLNGDGALTTITDYALLGNTDPKFYGGIQNNLKYKNFDLAFFFQFTKQSAPSYISQIGNVAVGSMINRPTAILNRWQKPGDVSEFEKFTSSVTTPAGIAQQYYALSDAAFADVSFIKLKNVSLSYQLPSQWLRFCKMSNCRIYLEGQNLLTITNYPGADPEVKDINSLSPLRTLAFGAQFNF